MYTEVLQDAVVDLIRRGRVIFVSTCSLTVTNECLQGICDDFDIRSVTNWSCVRLKSSYNPDIIRSLLSVISFNTAILTRYLL
jgi:Acetyl-CoA hydrolase